MYCRKCGSQVGDGDTFCRSCGTEVKAARQYAGHASSGDANDKRVGSSPATNVKRKRPGVAFAAAAIVVALAIGGVAFAATDGFGTSVVNGVSGPSTTLPLNTPKDPMDELVSAIEDIERDGSWSGDYDMRMTLEMGELGANNSVSMDGSYTILNYDPDNLSVLACNASINMDALGYTQNMTVNIANGECVVDYGGRTETESMSLEQVLQMNGVSSLDPSKIRAFAKSARREGDFIVVAYDEAYINELAGGSLNASGMDGVDLTYGDIEARYKLGSNQLQCNIDIPFEASYMGYDITGGFSMNQTVKG